MNRNVYGFFYREASMDGVDILKQVNVLNYDDGKKFIREDRIHTIRRLLSGTDYRQINDDGLFLLFGREKQIEKLPKKLILLSTHIDCKNDEVSKINRCFTDTSDSQKLIGTFDNSITNAAVIKLMISQKLPKNVVVAFTGDEEENSLGAKQTAKFLVKSKKKFTTIVLDVTCDGWDDALDFTIKNANWKRRTGKKVIRTAKRSWMDWNFISDQYGYVPAYVPDEYIGVNDSEINEARDYKKNTANCFSFCLPVNDAGEYDMHTDEGVECYRVSYHNYIKALYQIVKALD